MSDQNEEVQGKEGSMKMIGFVIRNIEIDFESSYPPETADACIAALFAELDALMTDEGKKVFYDSVSPEMSYKKYRKTMSHNKKVFGISDIK